MDIVYVTGNYSKYLNVKDKFESNNISIDYATLELEELEVNDIKQISLEKAKYAYDHIKRPLFVIDSGFYIVDYPNNPNYPGAFVKRSGISKNVDELIETMKDVDNRSCYFLDCLTYYDGKDYKQFFGECYGTLDTKVNESENGKALSNLWKVFIPKNCTKTLSEMTDDERKNRKDDHTSCTLEFLEWCKSTIN